MSKPKNASATNAVSGSSSRKTEIKFFSESVAHNTGSYV